MQGLVRKVVTSRVWEIRGGKKWLGELSEIRYHDDVWEGGGGRAMENFQGVKDKGWKILRK